MRHPVEPSNARVCGRYALHSAIASGGMGTVYFGRLLGPNFNRVVAIKRLHPELAADPEFTSMFLDEVRLAARIQHPNVVAALDAVEEGKELFFVMEYVHGVALGKLIRATRKEGKPVPPAIAATIAVGLLHGLQAAHDATSETGEPLGIVHRDVSPQNVVVGCDGVPRVLDFGIAKAVGRLQTTRAGQIKGKVAYLAPEQLRGQPSDRRTDIYGAAILLWEMLAGMRLFEGENDAIVLAKVLAGEVPSLCSDARDVPSALEEITRRGLDRDPEKRYATAREMALAIQRAATTVAPCEVGDWVAELAPSELAARAKVVAELEKLPVLAYAGDGARKLGVRWIGSTEAARTDLDAQPHASTRGALYFSRWVLGAAALSGLTVATWWHLRKPAKANASPVMMIDEGPLSEATLVTAARAEVRAGAAASDAVDSTTEVRPAAAETSSELVRAAGAVRASPRRSPPPAPSPSSAVSRATPRRSDAVDNLSCRPPFTIDAQGVKHFKVECL